MVFDKRKLSNHNVTVELKMEGRNLAAHRDIEAHSFYRTGDVVKLDGFSNFRVKIKKRVFIEREPGTTCRNYPNSDFQSYRECDDKYMRKRVDRIAPGLDLIPVWMTEDLSEVTTKPAIVSLKATGNSAISAHLKHLFLGPLENLWSGVDESNCPLPCEIFSTETKQTKSTQIKNSAGFTINFQQNVEVKTAKK